MDLVWLLVVVKGGNKENLPNIRNIIRLTDLLGKGNNKEIEFLSFDVHNKYNPRRPCINNIYNVM